MRQKDLLNLLRSIERKAEEWKRQGYDVKANMDDWSRPPMIGGIVPDLRAKRGDTIIIGEIETEDGLEANRERWETFKEYAEQNSNVSFRLFLMTEDGRCQLHKMFG